MNWYVHVLDSWHNVEVNKPIYFSLLPFFAFPGLFQTYTFFKQKVDDSSTFVDIICPIRLNFGNELICAMDSWYNVDKHRLFNLCLSKLETFCRQNADDSITFVNTIYGYVQWMNGYVQWIADIMPMCTDPLLLAFDRFCLSWAFSNRHF